MGVGTGFLFMIDSVIRELHIKNRRSSYARLVAGLVLAEIGAGFIYRFRSLLFIYGFTTIYMPLNYLLFRHTLVKA